MAGRTDEISETIYRIIDESDDPLETKEVHDKVQKKISAPVTRTKVLYRLSDLRGGGQISGKFVGSGKGVWVWWKRRGSKRG